MSNEVGKLYVVATPIGNLGDISARAIETLNTVDVIACEDTRTSARLLDHYGISTPKIALHEHNEQARTPALIARLTAGEHVALISDAGTPLVSDPGFRLVRAAHAARIQVSPLPGAAAFVAALSAAGLATDRFLFAGFAPARAAARRTWLEALRAERATLVFYESSHRIVEALADMVMVFGQAREATLARELTKKFETVRLATLSELAEWVAHDANQQRGEFVIVVAGAEDKAADTLDAEVTRIARLLAEKLSTKEAAGLAAEITGARKKEIYQYLVEHKSEGS